MANRFSNHNRFAAEELDTVPSQLGALPSQSQEALWSLRQEERERHAAAWRRNLSVAALAIVVAIAAWFIR